MPIWFDVAMLTTFAWTGLLLGFVSVWDLLLQPQGVLADVLDGLTTLRMLGMSLVMATFLTVAYGMLDTFLQAALDERE